MGIMAANRAGAEQPATTAGSQAALSKAAADKKFVFVFVTENNDDATQAARKTFETAAGKLADWATWVAVDRNADSEKEFVQKFGLARAPMPLVLAFAPNGAITGGFPASQLTEQRLQDTLVGDGMQQCLKALQARKLVFVCVQNGTTKLNDVATQGVNDFKADAKYAPITEVVKLDPTAAGNDKFLAQLKIDPKATEATTAMLAPPGALLAKFTGATEKKSLEAALQKASSGCGPSGCGPGAAGCGPAPKK